MIWINTRCVAMCDGLGGSIAPSYRWMKEMTSSVQAARRLAIGFSAALWATSGFAAETTVHVSLSDMGPDSVMMDGMHQFGMGKGMMTDMNMALMRIRLDIPTVAAGKVTFEVSNDSKVLIHEMVVSPITARDSALPYIADDNKIDEDAAGHLGEVAELDPGKSGALSVDLTPGLYILYCNIPGHYIGGMWTILTVTE